MPAVFIPPIQLLNPPVLPDTRGIARRLFRYLGPQPVGVSVVKVGGTYQTIQNPSQDLLTGLREGIEYFLGGHEYVVDDDIAALLVADLFTPDPVTWNELTGTWDSYSSDTWGTIA